MKLTNKEMEIIEYCKKYIDQMWATTIVGIILNCDFRDAKAKLELL